MAFARYEMGPAPRRNRDIYLFYFACGLATLAKGPLGLLLPGAIVVCYLFLSGDWGFLKRARIPTGAAVFVAVAAPWYVTMFALYGERFYNEFIVYNNVQRATGSGVHGARLDWLYYLRGANPRDPGSGGPWLQVGTWPWLGLFPAALFTYGVRRIAALAAKARGATSADDPESGTLRLALLLLGWAATAFAVFSVIPTKFNHYLLPVAPATALVAALWIRDAARGSVREPVGAAGLLFAAGIVAWIAASLGREPWNLLNLFIYEYGRADLQQFEVGPVYRYGGFAIAGLLALSGLVRRVRLQLAVGAGLCAVGLAVFGIDHYLVQASDCVSQRDAFAHYDAERRPGDRLVNWQMNYRGEVFYGRAQAVKAVSRTHLRWLLSRSPRSFIVANNAVYGGLRSALRQLTGREPHVLNPATCSTRMVLYDGPQVEPPTFEPRPGTQFRSLPSRVAHRLPGVRIGPDVSLLGYDLEWLGAGSDLVADVSLYLRCERETEEWWKVFLHGESKALPGRRAISDHIAGGDDYPSVAWRRGDIVRDHTRMRVGWILDALGGQGEVQVAAGLFHDNTRAQVTPRSAQDGENRIILGRHGAGRSVDARALDSLPAGVAPLGTPVRLEDVATLLAFEVDVRGEGPSALAEVTLYLRAERRTDERWQVFVHAVGPGDRRAVSDHDPGVGTARWDPGRIYVDRTILDVGSMGPGELTVYAGFFHGDRRAAVEPEESADGQRRIPLGRFDLR